MSNRVYTYSLINELKNAPYFAEIAALPQITMSNEMAISIGVVMPVFKGNVLSFSKFVTRLFPEWNTSGQRFAYVTLLNHFMRVRIEKSRDKAERDWLNGCKKNLYSAVSNILRLEESMVRPEDIQDTDRDIILFVEMWKHLEKKDKAISQFRLRMQDLKKPEVFEQAIKAILKFRGGKKQLVLHGFQFFTPMQQFVYDCFVNCGYDIFALIQEEARYPYANEVWNHLYTKENGFPEKQEWIRQKDLSEKNPIGEIFEGRQNVHAGNVRILKYANTVEFVEDIPRIKNDGFYIYSADDRSANRVLKDYFPERYAVRNLLSYPIGQFIYTLHRMWDETLQCITLNADGLRKCFASGWLSACGKSSINYTDDLERLLPYFEGCRTLEQWRERLDTFCVSYEDAYDAFAQVPVEDEKEERNRLAMGNPLIYFSPFSIKERHIGEVCDIIKQLTQMASTLFGENEPISIQQHMSKLESMLYMNDGMPMELYMEEREKVKQIFDVLESDRIRDFLCYPGDLATVLLAFMGGKADEDDEINNGLKTLVFNLFQVEAAPVAANGKVHICLSDIAKLPGNGESFGWPIDEQLLLGVIKNKRGTLLANWIDNMKITALSNRYYVYAACKNSEVEISWVYRQGEKLLSPSPYVTLLNKLSDARLQEPNVRRLDLQYVSSITEESRLNEAFNIRDNQMKHSREAELEYAQCPMRFVYGYILGNGSAYVNEYQQNRAIVRLIQSIYELLEKKYTVEQIAERVFKLFPYIRKAEKRQMTDDAKRWILSENGGGYSTLGDESYTNKRFNLVFPDPEVYVSAKKNAALLMSQEGKKGIFFEQWGKNQERNCEFCPHAQYCRDSRFGIDYKVEEA